MDEARLKELLENVAGGKIDITQALDRLKVLPFEDMEYARIDHHRALRRGFPEVIFCEGKTPEQILGISKKIVEHGSNLLATRCSAEVFEAVAADIPNARYHEKGSLFAV